MHTPPSDLNYALVQSTSSTTPASNSNRAHHQGPLSPQAYTQVNPSSFYSAPLTAPPVLQHHTAQSMMHSGSSVTPNRSDSTGSSAYPSSKNTISNAFETATNSDTTIKPSSSTDNLDDLMRKNLILTNEIGQYNTQYPPQQQFYYVTTGPRGAYAVPPNGAISTPPPPYIYYYTTNSTPQTHPQQPMSHQVGQTNPNTYPIAQNLSYTMPMGPISIVPSQIPQQQLTQNQGQNFINPHFNPQQYQGPQHSMIAIHPQQQQQQQQQQPLSINPVTTATPIVQVTPLPYLPQQQQHQQHQQTPQPQPQSQMINQVAHSPRQHLPTHPHPHPQPAPSQIPYSQQHNYQVYNSPHQAPAVNSSMSQSVELKQDQTNRTQYNSLNRNFNNTKTKYNPNYNNNSKNSLNNYSKSSGQYSKNSSNHNSLSHMTMDNKKGIVDTAGNEFDSKK